MGFRLPDVGFGTVNINEFLYRRENTQKLTKMLDDVEYNRSVEPEVAENILKEAERFWIQKPIARRKILGQRMLYNNYILTGRYSFNFD